MRISLFILFLLVSLVSSAQQLIELCAGESKTVTYFSTSTSDGTNTWTVNGLPYFSEELTYTFSDEGTYNIVLKRENGPCYVEETFQVVISECPSVTYWVPNTFTPDGDEHNQLFGPIMTEGFDVDNFTFLIFNRWGEIIWESHDPNGKWDGSYGGNICQDGIYSWKIQFNVFGNDGRIDDNGHVVILR